ncbi:MAG: hypothetical protein SOW71_07830, partial [Eubacteriales bacterium]|nr:hypothetical protein [Eubacteriales bacterium]
MTKLIPSSYNPTISSREVVPELIFSTISSSFCEACSKLKLSAIAILSSNQSFTDTRIQFAVGQNNFNSIIH